MKICTYNVNSIRARKNLVIEWLKHRNNDIDVLCFQEIKVVDIDFPYSDFENLGFFCEVWGQKAYNGVAILSKKPLKNVKKGFGDTFWDQQKRIISGKIDDITIINIYAPHGDLPGGDKYYYKLEWYDKFLEYLKENFSPEDNLIIVGDFNVARDDIDVYDPELLKGSIGTLPEEREKFEQIIEWGLIDTFRYLYPDKQQFTWWDYIGGAIWRNEGMRIDYILCTKPLIPFLKDVEVDLWARRRRKPTPSDHAPVIATFEF